MRELFATFHFGKAGVPCLGNRCSGGSFGSIVGGSNDNQLHRFHSSCDRSLITPVTWRHLLDETMGGKKSGASIVTCFFCFFFLTSTQDGRALLLRPEGAPRGTPWGGQIGKPVVDFKYVLITYHFQTPTKSRPAPMSAALDTGDNVKTKIQDRYARFCVTGRHR
jgi:hypothetical protein